MRTKIFSDTTCDLGLETLEKHDISVLPIHILLGEDDHLDGVDITSEQLFAFANEHKQLPKTAAVSLPRLSYGTCGRVGRYVYRAVRPRRAVPYTSLRTQMGKGRALRKAKRAPDFSH